MNENTGYSGSNLELSFLMDFYEAYNVFIFGDATRATVSAQKTSSSFHN